MVKDFFLNLKTKLKNIEYLHHTIFYRQAADYFKGEESNSSANKCMLKV